MSQHVRTSHTDQGALAAVVLVLAEFPVTRWTAPARVDVSPVYRRLSVLMVSRKTVD